MSFTETLFEIGVVVMTLIVVAAFVIAALLPIEVILKLAWPFGLLPVILAGVVYSCGRSLEYTKKNYLVYFAAASLIIGFTLFVFGFFTAIAKTPTEGLIQASDHYLICLIGFCLIGVSWLSKRFTGISCISTVRKLLSAIG